MAAGSESYTNNIWMDFQDTHRPPGGHHHQSSPDHVWQAESPNVVIAMLSLRERDFNVSIFNNGLISQTVWSTTNGGTSGVVLPHLRGSTLDCDRIKLSLSLENSLRFLHQLMAKLVEAQCFFKLLKLVHFFLPPNFSPPAGACGAFSHAPQSYFWLSHTQVSPP